MFFTHTRGYRIGTCVIGFICTEKTAKAPAAIGGIYFLRGEYSITTISIVRPKTSRIFPSGQPKNPGKFAKPPLSNREMVKMVKFKTAFGHRAGAATSWTLVSLDSAHIRFSPGSPSTRYPVFGDGLARALPLGPREGVVPYIFIIIIILLQFYCHSNSPLWPRKRNTRTVPTPIYYKAYTHRVLSDRPRHNRETPSLRAIVSTQTQILRRQWSGVHVILL